jgi:nitroreductase
MVARDDLHALLGIQPPWRMVGVVALGWPAEQPEQKPRKPLDKVVEWIA